MGKEVTGSCSHPVEVFASGVGMADTATDEEKTTMEIGYKLSSEEHPPADLVANAARAEATGFTFALISDHYHPWVDRQGQSPFVWGVLGALSQATEHLTIGTGVTCPTIRIHPAIIAQAAATAASLLPGRFFLGVGTGENLNEHVLGDHWPPAPVRIEMLAEALEVIRMLWDGEQHSHRGTYYTVENARLYSLPESPPPIMIAADGPKAITLAGKMGDGYIGLAPDADLLAKFDDAGGTGKPRYAEAQVCWHQDANEAKKIAYEVWPNAATPGQLNQELPLPAHFEQAAQLAGPEDMDSTVACGPDPEVHLDQIKKYADAGYDHVCVHQIGPDQAGFFEFYAREILPNLP